MVGQIADHLLPADRDSTSISYHRLNVGLLDHLIRLLQERRRDRQAENLGGLEVDDELKPFGPLDRHISRLGTRQDFPDKDAGPVKGLTKAWSIG